MKKVNGLIFITAQKTQLLFQIFRQGLKPKTKSILADPLRCFSFFQFSISGRVLRERDPAEFWDVYVSLSCSELV